MGPNAWRVLAHHCADVGDPLDEPSVRRWIRHVNARSEHCYRGARGRQGPAMGRGIDPPGRPTDNGYPLTGETPPDVLRDLPPIGGAGSSAHDRDRMLRLAERVTPDKQGCWRVGQVQQLGGILVVSRPDVPGATLSEGCLDGLDVHPFSERTISLPSSSASNSPHACSRRSVTPRKLA